MPEAKLKIEDLVELESYLRGRVKSGNTAEQRVALSDAVIRLRQRIEEETANSVSSTEIAEAYRNS